MRVFGFIAAVAVVGIAAQALPAVLEMPAGPVQEKILIALLPVLAVFLWRSS